jgi:hypothetical protein
LCTKLDKIASITHRNGAVSMQHYIVENFYQLTKRREDETHTK